MDEVGAATGAVTGAVTGTVTGAATGAVTGTVTGTVTGVPPPVQLVSAKQRCPDPQTVLFPFGQGIPHV